MTPFSQQQKVLYLTVRVQPNARRSAFAGLWNGTHLKIALAAPPVDGKANEALISFLSDFFEIRLSAVTILSGQTARQKRLALTFPTESDVQKALSKLTAIL